VLSYIVQNINRERFIPEVVIPKDGPLLFRLSSQNIKTHKCSLTRWVFSYEKFRLLRFIMNLSGFPVRFLKLVYLIKTKKIDIVHTNTITVIDGAIAAKYCKIPHIWHIHEILPQTSHLKFYLPLRFIFFLIAKLSQTVVVVSQAVKKSILDIYTIPQITVVNNGIPVNELRFDETYKKRFLKEHDLPDNVILVAIIGSIIPIKGHEDLIDAVLKVRCQISELHLIIVGDPSMDRKYVELLKSKIAESGMESCVHFMGYREDVIQILQAIDIVAIPSWVDSFPTIALQAMMQAKPVIATRSGGIEEIVEDGVSGFLVDKRDVNAMAEKLLILARDEKKRLSMGKKGRYRLEKCFSLPIFINNMEEIYMSM